MGDLERESREFMQGHGMHPAAIDLKTGVADFLREMGLSESALNQLIRVGYGILHLITFYTTVGTELRAWTIPRGTHVPQAAGKIHTDMERGFIRAEVISFAEFTAAGSMAQAREKGLIRVEGKDYIVQDGEILHIRFHV